MGGGGGCRCVRDDVSLVRVMVVWRSLSRLFMLILVGLVLTGCLVSCVLRFSYCVLCFSKKCFLWNIIWWLEWYNYVCFWFFYYYKAKIF